MTKNLVVDDHLFFLQGFTQYLKYTCDFEVETALSVDEAIAKIEVARPDLAVFDLMMNNGGGLRLLRHMCINYSHIPAMFFTVHIDPEQTIEAIRLGIKGIAFKDSDPEVIIKGMNTILAGGKWFEPNVTERALQYSIDKPNRADRSDDLLTKREMEIVKLVCLGLRNRQIADRCSLTEGTVKIHLNNVYRKLGIASRAELIVRHGCMRSNNN